MGIFYYIVPALYMKQKVLLEGGLRLVKSVYSKLYADNKFLKIEYN